MVSLGDCPKSGESEHGQKTLLYRCVIKPCPNGLASERQFSTCAQLAFCLATHLRWLALTLVELKFVRKSTQVFHRLATQLKSTQVDRKSAVYAWNLRPFATCESVRKFVHMSSSGFANLRWLASTSESVWPAFPYQRFDFVCLFVCFAIGKSDLNAVKCL